MTKTGDNKSNSDHMDFIGWTNKCQSDVIIYDAQYYMTGYYSCHYNDNVQNQQQQQQQSESTEIHNMPMATTSIYPSNDNSMDSIFIFINGLLLLFVFFFFLDHSINHQMCVVRILFLQILNI